MRFDRVWFNVVQTGLFSNTSKIDQVDFRDALVPARSARVDASLTHCNLDGVSDKRLKSVATHDDPTWPTFSTQSMATQYIDLQVFLAAKAEGKNVSTFVSTAWTSCFFC